jgi:hypothetical protein
MKKFTLFLASVLISFVAVSQTFVSESFDGTTFPPTGWQNLEYPTGTTNIWSRVTTGTYPTCTTHSGAGMAKYNCFTYSAGKSAILVTPVINLSGLGSNVARISFWMYRDNYIYSVHYDSLDVYVGTSLTNGIPLGKINRDRTLAPIESTDGWYKYYFDIPSSYNSATNYVIFKATSQYGDNIYIDDILIQVPPTNDAGITAINAPNTPVSIGSSAVTTTIKNFGISTLTTATIAWSVNGVVQTPHPWNGSLAASATAGPVSIGNYNFSSAGLYTIKSWTENPNGSADGNYSNDTTTKVVYVQSSFAALPFTENFDGTWINKLDTNDVPSIYWLNTPAMGNQSWRRNDEGATANWTNLSSFSYTPTGSLGTLHSARFHSDAPNHSTGIMDAFLNFTSTGNKTLTFWYINTSGSDSLKVYLSTDGGNTFTQQGQYATTSTWQWKQLSLGTSTSATVVVRFKAISDYGTTDIGLDGVQVSIASAIDVGVTSIIKPLSKPCGLVSDSVNVMVKNFGSASQSNIPVTVNIITPSGNVALNGTLAGPLASNAMDTLFVGFANTTAIGNYTFKAFTALTGDSEHLNDTTSSAITISVSGTPIYPYVENFESSTSLANWTTNMSRTYTANDHGNTSYVLYKNLYSYSSLATATSNKKIGTLTSTSVLTFDYRYTNYSAGTVGFALGLDSLVVQVSDDCGATFTTVHVINAANHITSANMKNVLVSLSAYAGDDILVKFIAQRGTTGDYYIDIDNINVLDAAYVGVNEYSDNPNINIFPNPTNGMINVVINGINNADLTIYTLQGQMVYAETLNAATRNKQLDLSYLSKGIYMIRISDKKNNIIKKLILQ